jgi:class 3 adenylate cyclase
MAEARVGRRLAAIVAADVAGYSRLMHKDEEGTHAKLAALLANAVNPAIAAHGGRIVKNTGDGFLAEFPSAVEAVRAAVQFQARIKELTLDDVADRQIAFRVGINIGDVIVEPHDIFGDGVNIAARLESIAEPGSNGGRIANTAGDSVLAEFGSAVDAVQCAVEAPTALAEANAGLAPDRRTGVAASLTYGSTGGKIAEALSKRADSSFSKDRLPTALADLVSPVPLLECLCQAPAVQGQQDDMQHQHRGQVEHKCISDEREVAKYRNDAKIDHVLHAESDQH